MNSRNIYFYLQLLNNSFNFFGTYHKGSLSKNSFKFWKRNGGKDREGFVWKGKGITKKKKTKKKNDVKSVHQTFKEGTLSVRIIYK